MDHSRSTPAVRLSLWRDRPPIEVDSELAERYDDVVVGAGITGLTTGLLLARAGRAVAVIEARDVGAVTTGNTTGKVSLLQGTRLSSIRQRQSDRVARAYVESNREGQAWLLRFCDDHGVPYQRRTAATYGHDEKSLASARDEYDAARALGLPVAWTDDLGVAFPHQGAAVLADQAQLDAMDVLAALVAEIRRDGGTVVTGHRVVGVPLVEPSSVKLEDGREIRADNVVLATGTPILDRGLYFAKLEPQRSYALAFRHPAPPELMAITAGSPTRSVRDAPGVDGPLLLVGGEGHVVGRGGRTEPRLQALRDWTHLWYPDAVETHSWSAQDYASHDYLPAVGALPRGRGHVYVATGYAKWGLTNGVAAALSLAKQIHGHEAGWQRRISHRIIRPSGAMEIVRLNTAVASEMIGGIVGAQLRQPRPPRCTHLGGVLAWNDAECTWDCPLHGSRFDAEGAVLEGPATQPLPLKSQARTGRNEP